MSNVAITVTAYGNSVLNDLLGIEAYAKPGTWVSQSFSFGTTVTFEVPGNVWTRLRPLLSSLANRRIPALDSNGLPLASGKTMPALTYTMDWIPGDRPRIHRALIGVAGGSAAVAATGRIEAVAGGVLTDGETFTLSDGVNTPTTFEFDDNASVTPGNVAIVFAAPDTADIVAGAIATAVNGVVGTLDVTAAVTGSVVTLTNAVAGAAGNVNIINNTVMDITGMSGGADASTTTSLSLASPGNITLAGTNLLAGVAASLTLQSWSAAYSYGNPGTRTFTQAVDALRITALAKGPVGNKIAVTIKAPALSGSVTSTLGDDGDIHIVVTPVTGAATATAIAAQINNVLAPSSVWVVATALVGSALISPTSTVSVNGISPGGLTASNSGQIGKVYLSGGDGGGLSRLDVPVVAGVQTNRLVLVSRRAGNNQNLITLRITVSSGVGTVATLSGSDITVACNGATETLANIETAINNLANGPVIASAVGSGSLGALAKTWLHSGGGEAPAATVAGAPATVVSQSDSQMVLSVTSGALSTAGATVGQIGVVQLQMNYGLVNTDIGPLVA
jgi:hypothetical protein